MNFSELISKNLAIGLKSVQNTVELLDEGATIPFIARYRKERTGSLDEVQLLNIQKELKRLNDLLKRKESILKSIEEQGALTSELKRKIKDTWDDAVLEDLYLPYKRKTKTKATVAEENGLMPLAKTIMSQRSNSVMSDAKTYVKGNVKNTADAIEGAQHIIAEWVNENITIRDIVREVYRKSGALSSKVVTKKKAEAEKYKDYFEFSESIKKIPSHRILALFRAEDEKLLKVKLEIDEESAQYRIEKFYIKSYSDSERYIQEAIADSMKRLLQPSIGTEFRKILKDRADDEAIQVFSNNLQELLLAAPLGSKAIMGLDPGFRSGCKLVCLDETGALKYNTAIYPHPPQSQYDESKDSIQRLVKKYKIEAIAIGNGTAGKETHALVKSINFDTPVEIFMVNESGASIYSASEVAREEFPDHDLTVRGSVSIGRRLADPLSELVKIDAKSIGVGQYQHDVNQKKLKENLDHTVLSCVNKVGINLNTASEYLLTYVSGLGPTLAKNIVTYRQENGLFDDISQLKKVARMGKKAFEQSAGFLRIKEGKNLLDNTGVHPERYSLVNQIAKEHKLKIDQMIQQPNLKDQIDMKRYISDEVGMPTLQDIFKELAKPGLDPRGSAKVFSFAEGVNTMADLRPDMIVPGIINNVTKFGAFVDIGIKESGLVHISQITNRYISDPAEVVKVNQKVQVKVLEVDIQRKRVSLSMKGLN